MLGHLIRKEILDHLLSLRFMILSAVGALIIGLSLFSGYDYYRDSLKDYRLSQSWTENQIRERVKSDNLGYVMNIGYSVQKPPTPMSIFVSGIEPTLGQTCYMNWLEIRRLKCSPVAEEPALGLFPSLDLAAVVQVVLSLFVLLLTYDVVCGEKEGGTLRLTSSFSVPRDRLLLGKMAGALILTLSAFGVPLLLGVGVIFLLPDVQFQAPELMRMGLILTAFGLYLAAFTCAGVLGSSLTHRAATSFVILLFFWVGAVAVLPRIILIAADVFRPAPSTQRLQADLMALGQANNQKRYALENEWKQAYYTRTGKQWWETPDGREGYTLIRIKVRSEAQVRNRPEAERLEEAFRNRYNARLGLAVTLARFSPAFALNNAAVRLAGTGVDRHQRFLRVYNTARDRLTDWYWEEWVQASFYGADPQKYKYVRDLSDVPRLVYQETWPDEDIQTALVDVAIVALWGLICFAGAYVALLRYDLR